MVDWSVGRQQFDVDGGGLSTAKLTDIRSTYPFSTRSFRRFTLQYSDHERDQGLYLSSVQSRSKELTTHLLYGYKVNAASRFFTGYCDAGVHNHSDDSIEHTNRTFFAQFSDAWQPQPVYFMKTAGQLYCQTSKTFFALQSSPSTHLS